MEYDELSFAASAALSDPEFAQSLPELEALLFKDVGEPDFREGAEALHPFSSNGMDDASTTWISQDNDWLKSDTGFSNFNLDDIFIDDKQQKSSPSQNDSIEASSSSSSSPTQSPSYYNPYEIVDNYSQPSSLIKNEFKDDLHLLQPILFQDCDLLQQDLDNNQIDECIPQNVESIPYVDDSLNISNSQLSSTDSISLENSGEPYIILPEDICLNEEVVSSDINESSIISVPIQEAISSESYPEESIVLEDDPMEQDFDQVFTTSSPAQNDQPQKFVISLKRVCIPHRKAPRFSPYSKNSVKVTTSTAPQRTLKEVLCSNDGDDLLRDLVNPQNESPNLIEETHLSQDTSSSIESYLSVSSPSSSICSSITTEDEGIIIPIKKPRKIKEPFDERYAPYGSKEKKERKKEQNKRAALRYRQKKKEEEDFITAKVEAEEEKKLRLQEDVKTLQQELVFVKKMLRDMVIKKRKSLM